MRALVVLATDPGPSRFGWAIIVILFTQRGIAIHWVAGDHEVWSTALCLRLLDRANDEALLRDADILVVSEIVTGKVYAGRSDTNVLDTSRACGRLTPVAELLDLLRQRGRLAGDTPRATITTAEYATAPWQAALTGYAKDVTQEVVNLCVRGTVAGLPQLPKSRNGIPYAEHILDAGGIAIAAGHMARGKMRVGLPLSVEAEIGRLVAAERARRSAKGQANRHAKAAGLIEPKPDLRQRPRSRAERARRHTSALIAAARRA